MFSFLHLNPDNMVWFYLAPLLVFGPIFFGVLWNFGLKNIFSNNKELHEQQRLENEHNDYIAQRRIKKAGSFIRRPPETMRSSLQWIGQAALYATLAGVLGTLSVWPSYRYNAEGLAQVKLSLSHPGLRVEPCRKRTAEELAGLAPNMRAKMKCSRERWPVMIKFMLDGNEVFNAEAKATGLHQDGSSSFYKKFSVPAGIHTLSVHLNDAGPQSDFAQQLTQTIELKPAQNLVIGFHEDGSGFYLK